MTCGELSSEAPGPPYRHGRVWWCDEEELIGRDVRGRTKRSRRRRQEEEEQQEKEVEDFRGSLRIVFGLWGAAFGPRGNQNGSRMKNYPRGRPSSLRRPRRLR